MYPSPPQQPQLPRQQTAAAGPVISLTLLDCLTGERENVTQFPRLIHEYNMRGQTVAVEFRAYRGALVLSLATGVVADSVLVNDSPLTSSVSIPAGVTVSLLIGRRLILFRFGADDNWPPYFESNLWQVFDVISGELLGELPPREITTAAVSHGWNLAGCAVCPRGLDTGFRLASVADLLTAPAEADSLVTDAAASGRGRYFCPACWLRFDAGDVLSIAAHESLRNDPVLGPDAMLRFYPTHFNDYGQAIDPMGLPAVDLACPHCRRPLPPGYLDLSHKIFSLIGAPSAGKSYFLAVLTHVLQERLFKDFGLVFKDGDPTGNMLLNLMRTRLFSGSTPEECMLGKTAMEGATYERLPRLGKWVALPRPFIYILNSGENKDDAAATGDDDIDALRNAAVIFYDNAGEHFEPGHNMEDSPGAMHVVSSAGIFFLYDPTSNPRFRRELIDCDDPQLRQHGRADQQDSILSEMEVRVKTKLGLHPAEKIPVPVAILVGKCDVWKRLLDVSALPSPVAGGTLDNAIIDANSARVRSLLAEFCPGLVAHAESLSSDVRYFGVSSLGHSPILLTQGVNTGVLAPDPAKLAPVGIVAPAYWLLSKALPHLIPAK
jgi:hypothetical protein